MGRAYEEAYRKFSEKYGNLNVGAAYDVSFKLGSMDDFTFDSTSETRLQNAYRGALRNVLRTYLTDKIEMKQDKNYDLSDFSVTDFIQEFDNVIQGHLTDKAAEEGTTYEHKPYAGLSFDQIAGAAWNRAKEFNKPVNELWAEQIRDGKLSLETLQSTTSSSIRMLDDMAGSNIKYTDAAKNDLANVVLAQKTMEAAINKRSWTSWLNPRNWFPGGPNRRENAYLKELNEKLQTYKERNYPTESVLPEAYGKNLLSNAAAELNAYVQQNKKANPAPEKTDAKKKDAKKSTKQKDVVGKVPTKEVADALLKDKETVKANLLEVVGDYIEAHDKEHTSFMCGYITKGQAEKCWDAFNKATDEAQKRAVLADYSKKMFKGMYDHAISITSYGKAPAEKLVMTQKLADFVLNTYFPVASNSKYAEFGNNYYLKNADPETLSKDMYGEHSPEELKPALEQARFERGVTSKMPLDTSNDFVDKAPEKAPKINNISAPEKSKSKDRF
jgi:hypothetical protein